MQTLKLILQITILFIKIIKIITMKKDKSALCNHGIHYFVYKREYQIAKNTNAQLYECNRCKAQEKRLTNQTTIDYA